jgi:hypothetical protein
MHHYECNFPGFIIYPSRKDSLLEMFKREGWGLIRFRRSLYGETLEQWEEMKRMVDGVQLFDEKDKVKWKIGASRKFRVKEFSFI